MLQMHLSAPADTERLARALAACLSGAETLALSGPLGAGKTFLVRQLCLALGVRDNVSSPSYVLLHEYDSPNFAIHHFDLYRLDSEEEAWELGLRELFGRGLTLIEWPEVAERLLPADAIRIGLDYDGEGRKAVLRGSADWLAALNRVLQEG